MNDILDKICRDLKRWVNHPKGGTPRSEHDLTYFDSLWASITAVINKIQHNTDPLDQEEKDILQMLKYEGTLYRIHLNYDRKPKNYGIRETCHYVSWSKTDDIDNFYWLFKNMDFITITAQTTPELFGIDLVGFNDFIRKYIDPNFSIGSSAIIKEQEVVYPIKLSAIQAITPTKP